MSNHYYTEKPNVESSRRTLEVQLRGNKLKFISDAGIFSKKEVDFGTRVLLGSFPPPTDKSNILDIGCGYGPVGLSIAKEAPNSDVMMVDINERAIELSLLNAKLNDIKNVEIRKSNLFSEIEDRRTFDFILSNPPIRAGKQVVHQLFTDAIAHLEENGELWIVIQKKQGAPSAIEKLKQLFTEVTVVKKAKGYYIIRSRK